MKRRVQALSSIKVGEFPFFSSRHLRKNEACLADDNLRKFNSNQTEAMEISTAARTLLEHKSRDIWTISPAATVYQAIQMMSEKNIGALPVVDGTRLVGMISERDYMSKVALHGKSSRETPVSDIMTREIVTVGPDQNISSCLEIITEHRIRHLPVLDGDDLLGIISIGDLVKWIIETQRMTIQQLNAYISGGYAA
jgi:CBS domain-containing protein